MLPESSLYSVTGDELIVRLFPAKNHSTGSHHGGVVKDPEYVQKDAMPGPGRSRSLPSRSAPVLTVNFVSEVSMFSRTPRTAVSPPDLHRARRTQNFQNFQILCSSCVRSNVSNSVFVAPVEGPEVIQSSAEFSFEKGTAITSKVSSAAL